MEKFRKIPTRMLEKKEQEPFQKIAGIKKNYKKWRDLKKNFKKMAGISTKKT